MPTSSNQLSRPFAFAFEPETQNPLNHCLGTMACLRASRSLEVYMQGFVGPERSSMPQRACIRKAYITCLVTYAYACPDRRNASQSGMQLLSNMCQWVRGTYMSFADHIAIEKRRSRRRCGGVVVVVAAVRSTEANNPCSRSEFLSEHPKHWVARAVRSSVIAARWQVCM